MSENIKNTAAESAQNAAGAAEAVTHDMTVEAVNEPVQADAGVYTHTFKKPFEYAGETYTTMTFDFEKMTGRDMVSIETEMQMNNEYCLAPEVSRSFQAKMAAKAAGIGSDVLDAMPMPARGGNCPASSETCSSNWNHPATIAPSGTA